MKRVFGWVFLLILCALVGGIGGYAVSHVLPGGGTSRGPTIHVTPPQTTAPYLQIPSLTPTLTFQNFSATNAAGGRLSEIIFKGQDSTRSESTLAKIRVYHPNYTSDQSAVLQLATNDGNDGDTPSEIFTMDQNGNISLTGAFTGTVLSGTNYIQTQFGSLWTYLDDNRLHTTDNSLFLEADSDANGTNQAINFKVGNAEKAYLNISGNLQFSGGGALVMTPKGSDPCSILPQGAVFWNMSSYYPCYCDNAGADLKISDDSACF